MNPNLLAAMDDELAGLLKLYLETICEDAVESHNPRWFALGSGNGF